MIERDKKIIEELLSMKTDLQEQNVFVDSKISSIERSSKSTFGLFQRLHDKCRQADWYYNWHLNPLSNLVHKCLLLILILGAGIGLFFLQSPFMDRARADSWTSVQSGNWNVGPTWGRTVCTSGCRPGIDYPNIDDTVRISNSNSITMPENVNLGVGTLTIDSGSQLDTGSKNFTASTLTLDGTLNGGSSLITIDTVNITGRLNLVSSTMSIGAFSISGRMDITGSSVLTVSGNWHASGSTINPGNSTVNLVGNSSTDIVSSGQAFNNLTINKPSAIDAHDNVSLSDSLDVNGDFTLSDGELILTGYDANFAGNFSIASSGKWTKGSGLIKFDGNSAKNFTDNTSTKQNIGVVSLDKVNLTESNNKLTLNSSMTVDKMTIDGTSGQKDTLSLGSSGFVLSVVNSGTDSNVLIVNGYINPGISVVKISALNSSGDINIPIAAFSTLQLSGVSETYNLTGNLTNANAITGDLIIDSGVTLNTTVNNYDIALAGNWNNNGTFTANGGRVTLNGSSNKDIRSSGSSFNNLEIKDLGMVGNWGMNENTGEIASDSSGFGNDGTASVTSIVDGYSGKARSYDGNIDALSIPNSGTINVGSNLTLAAWIKKTERSRAEGVITKGSYGLKVGADDRPYFEVSSGSETINDVGRAGTNIYIFCLTVFEGRLYAGTYGSGTVYRYDGGTTWTSIGRLGLSAEVRTLTVYNGKLYGGVYPNSKVYRYDGGTTWTDVGRLGADDSEVRSAVVYNGQMYAASFPSNKVYLYDGVSTWNSIGSADDTEGIAPLIVFKDKLYYGTMGTGNLYRYDGGSSWTATGGLGSGDIVTLATFEDNLYIGTNPKVSGQAGHVYRYSGSSSWVDMGTLGTNPEVSSMTVYNGKLYAGSSTSGKVYRFNSAGSWTDIGQLGSNIQVLSMAVYDGKLFAGTVNSGRIYTIGDGAAVYGTTAMNVDQWNYLAATYNGSTVRLYVNGVESASQNKTLTVDTNTKPLLIGADSGSVSGGCSGGGSGHFKGLIDEVRLYNRLLTAPEVTSFNNGVDPFSTYTLKDDLAILGSLTLRAGKIDVSADNYTVRISGSYANSADFIPRSGKVIFNATSTGKTIQSTPAFNNVEFNGIGGEWRLNNQRIDINGNLNILNGTLDANGQDVNLGGNWSNGDVFVPGSGSLILDGADGSNQDIAGSNTFHNLIAGTSNNLSGRSIRFEDGSTQTMTGSLEIAGQADKLLALKCLTDSACGWSITANSHDITYADISNSTAIGDTLTSINSKDSGNNINWNLVSSVTVELPDSGIVRSSIPGTITTRDVSGALTNTFVGDVSISLSSGNGSVTPVSIAHADFSNGSWSGSFVFSNVENKTLRATMPHGVYGEDTILIDPDALHHFLITGVASSIITRDIFDSPVVVTAYDQWGNVKTNYRGEVYFTSTDAEALLPYTITEKYSFTIFDSGSHSFPGSGFVLKTITTNNGVSNQTITLTDEVSAISATTDPIQVKPAAASTFEVVGMPDSTIAGDSIDNISVTVKDLYGNIKTDYEGSVWFTTTDTHDSVVMPYTSTSPYIFTVGDGNDNGVHTFSGFVLITANLNHQITVTDGPDGAADLSSPNIYINPAVIHHFTMDDYPVCDPGTYSQCTQFATAGYDWTKTGKLGGTQAPYDVVVVARDAYNNVKKDFADAVWFTIDNAGVEYTFKYFENSEGNKYQFTSDGGAIRTSKSDISDNGKHIFDATDFLVKTASISAPFDFSVRTSGDLFSTFKIKVKPAAIASVQVLFAPVLTSKSVNLPLTESVLIKIYDVVGNIKTDYTGNIYFASSDTSATLPYKESNKYTFSMLDAGQKTFSTVNTPQNYFTFNSGGNHSLSVVADGEEPGSVVYGYSPNVTVSAHVPTDLEATAGHTQVTLDWMNPTDQAVSMVNIYQSTASGELGSKVASVNVNASTYSQYVVTGLTNGISYFYTLKSVVKSPSNEEVESSASTQVSAMPLDIAPRNVTAAEMADGKVKIDYDLVYNSTVSIEYFKVATNQWQTASAQYLSGEVGENKSGVPELIHHTAYWLARGDFEGQYYSSSQGFKVRVKVVVPSQGNATAVSPSPAFILDTQAPSNTSLKIDASGGTTADLTIAATDNGTNAIEMMIANEETFEGKNYQPYSTTVDDWDLGESERVYIRFRDPYSNISTIYTDLTSPVENFMLKDVSDLRVPAYQIFISWGASSVPNLQNYIIEFSKNDEAFSELIRTNQTGFIHLNLERNTQYSYRIKIITSDGNISRPSRILSTTPGLAPDITAMPTVEVFGYKQDVGVKAIVHWETDQPADSFVAFSTEVLSNNQNTLTEKGETANIIGQLDRVMSHEVTITNMLPGKKYYLKALSQNDQKITGYSNVFELDTPAYLPLQIQHLDFKEIRTDSVYLVWQTNKLATTELYYGIGSSFDKTLTDDKLNSDHTFKLENLIPGSSYRIKIRSVDEDGNYVLSDEYTFTPPATPEVTGIQVIDITNNSATVTWNTNVNTDSNVEYGLTTAYGAQSGKSDFTTKHSVILLGLESNTSYNFKVKSKDEYGNEAVSQNAQLITVADVTPPKISDIQSQLSQISTPQGPKYQAVVSWKTDEGATSQVEYGDNAAGQYTKTTSEDGSYNMTHVVILSDLKANSAYSFRVVSKDKADNESKSVNSTIITPPQERSLIQIVLNSLSDTFSWVGKLRAKWIK